MRLLEYFEILGFCFLCWLSATLLHKLYVLLSHKTGLLRIMMWPVVVAMLLLFALGLPVTAAMGIFRQSAFQKTPRLHHVPVLLAESMRHTNGSLRQMILNTVIFTVRFKANTMHFDITIVSAMMVTVNIEMISRAILITRGVPG